MRTALALGVRLAWCSPAQRSRSALVAAAAALGSTLLLCAVAIAGAERAASLSGYDVAELRRLSAVVVLVVALPVLALAATVARLSASLRDRRLANLRLLGLSPVRTRLVAAAEAASSSLVGAATGVLAFVALRLLLGETQVADRPWTFGELRPGATAYVVAALGLPVVVMGIASLPQRLNVRRTLERAHRADLRRPSPWRALPLAAGLGLGLMTWDIGRGPDHTVSHVDVTLLFVGVGLTGLGMVLVVPVFVRLLADLLHGVSSGPVTLIAARRLQAQPAAVTRLVSALMIGLFLVTGARGVVVAFESTPQYEDAAANVEVEQRAVILSGIRRLDADVAAARRIEGVRDVVTFPVLHGNPGERLRRNPQWPTRALVGSCDDLARLAPAVTSCRDGEPMMLTPWWSDEVPAAITLSPGKPQDARAPSLTVPTPRAVMQGDDGNAERQQLIRPMYADIFLPLDTPGLQPLLRSASRESVVLADPGRHLEDALHSEGLQPLSATDLAGYDFVASLRTLVWTVAGVILALGLLTFAIAAIDRAVARRREMVSLQLLGTPPGVLHRAQWVEAALPTAIGTVFAIAAGFYAGASYLRLDGQVSPPLRQSLGLALAALAASALVAGLTVVAGATRITPDRLRAE